ncbi:exosome complex component RRP46-like isoform X2 [Dermatophagoides pteronyssinus]
MASDTDHVMILSNLNRSSGSSLYTFGDNIVQCSLFGPNPIASSQNLLKKNYFVILLYPLGQIKNLTKDKSLFYYEFYFKMTFSPMVYHALLPRSRTYIILNEIEKGSSFLSTSLNAITLSLIDCGYPLNYCIATCGLILDKRDGLIYREKEFKEKCEKNVRSFEPITFTLETCDFIKATFHISNKNNDSKTVSILAEGQFSLNDVLKAQQQSLEWNQSFFRSISEKISHRFV